MYLIKLGGSVITIKSRYRTFRWKATTKILDFISKLNENVILVHGGGSFGHIMAKKYGIPGVMTEERKEGFSIVHMDMLELNSRICRLTQEFIGPCVSIPPAIAFENMEKTISNYLNNGVIPVLFGDSLIRGDMAEIISGDEIMYRIARGYSPDKVVFITDVDGVYTSNPKVDPDARLLKVLSGQVQTSLTYTDVTGGMGGKIEVMKKIADLGSRVYVVNGRRPERLLSLGKEEFVGTVIE